MEDKEFEQIANTLLGAVNKAQEGLFQLFGQTWSPIRQQTVREKLASGEWRFRYVYEVAPYSFVASLVNDTTGECDELFRADGFVDVTVSH